ncbi:MAG: cyclic-di-AMP receptor [Chloroflexota bacterium]
MKLIIAIVHDYDADNVTRALTSAEFRVTRIASTGGLLRRGVTTLMIGVEDNRVEPALEILRGTCSPSTDEEKRATIFVVPVTNFVQV